MRSILYLKQKFYKIINYTISLDKELTTCYNSYKETKGTDKMLNAYLVKYQRKIGAADWETTLSTYSLENDDREEWKEELLSMMKISDITEYSIKDYTLRDVFNFYRTDKKWYDNCHCVCGYKYKKFNPYISLRIKYEKTSISMEKLFKMDSEKVIQYLRERGIEKL